MKKYLTTLIILLLTILWTRPINATDFDKPIHPEIILQPNEKAPYYGTLVPPYQYYNYQKCPQQKANCEASVKEVEQIDSSNFLDDAAKFVLGGVAGYLLAHALNK